MILANKSLHWIFTPLRSVKTSELKRSIKGMNTPTDNGYISDYLIHWTGKDGDERGAHVLSIIASTLRMLLSYNRLHIFDWYHEVHEKMACFTDVPLRHSGEHCKRYGRFGIAFHKLMLMNVGAQPVFYASHACKSDMDTIFRFLQEQTQHPTLPPKVFRALHRHFYLIQRLSDGPADRRDTFYYEREWRLGEQTLVPEDKLRRPNTKYWSQQEGYPPYTGRLVTDVENTYFAFDVEHVAFLVSPQSWQAKIDNPHGFPIEAFEDFVCGNRERMIEQATPADG